MNTLRDYTIMFSMWDVDKEVKIEHTLNVSLFDSELNKTVFRSHILDWFDVRYRTYKQHFMLTSIDSIYLVENGKFKFINTKDLPNVATE